MVRHFKEVPGVAIFGSPSPKLGPESPPARRGLSYNAGKAYCVVRGTAFFCVLVVGFVVSVVVCLLGVVGGCWLVWCLCRFCLFRCCLLQIF